MSKFFTDTDQNCWIIVNVSYVGEQQSEEVLQQEVFDTIGECEIFFPSSSEKIDNEKIIKSIMPGYIFIKTSSIRKNPYLLENNRFFDHIVTIAKNRKERRFKLVTNQYIDTLRQKLKSMMFTNLRKGQSVVVTKGLYSSLQGEVVKVLDTSKNVVKISLASKTIEVEVPQVCLTTL